MKDEECGLNSNPIGVPEGDKRRALGAKLEKNVELVGSPQNTNKYEKIFNNSPGPSGTKIIFSF